MSLIVLTGPVRCGKSRIAEDLAASHGGDVVCPPWPAGPAMARWSAASLHTKRLARRGGRASKRRSTLRGWPTSPPKRSCCSTASVRCWRTRALRSWATCRWPPRKRSQPSRAMDVFLAVLLGRDGDTVVVTNETGWGVVPQWASARIFRDELGRANRRLVDAADAAYLVVAGRCMDLSALTNGPEWPTNEEKEGS